MYIFSTILLLGPILPKYYFLPEGAIAQERQTPGSQSRVASNDADNGHMFLWGQSVYIISQLLGKPLVILIIIGVDFELWNDAVLEMIFSRN